MIDEKRRRIYVDYSTLKNFRTCEELSRLGSVLGYQKMQRDEKLEFGSAIHAGWKAMYDNPDDAVDAAKVAFLRRAGVPDGVIPLVYEPAERRSLERGMMLLEAYRFKWRNERFINFPTPLTEQGFLYYITTFEGYDVFYVGYIDRIMIRSDTQRAVGFEGKTTAESLSWFRRRVKPNRQITGYYKGAQHILRRIGWDGPELREFVWDMMFLSTRAPDYAKASKGSQHRFWMYGIDIDSDLDRANTSRSEIDFTEFLYDVEQHALDYCRRLTSHVVRWPRSDPDACYARGQCRFVERCSLNLTPEQEHSFLESHYRVDKWEPWRDIVDTFEVVQ